MNWFRDHVFAVLSGSAVGDALGGATEGFSPEQIQERYHGRVSGIVPPFFADWQTRRPISPYHKGDGNITDDTLMTQALVQVYESKRAHLDAFDIAEILVPILINEPRWIPELERETVLVQRIFFAEKYLVTRLHYGHIDPREAGVGNIVNCGAAMYMAPVGIVNASQPEQAYREAIEIAGAHQSSYGREAAGVFAAAVAQSLTPGATVTSVIDAALQVAHDGTREAIAAVVRAAKDAVACGASDDDIAETLRDAVRPFDTVGEHYREPNADARLPSRTKSIEELPIALGLVVAYDGDFTTAVLAGVNYGRDSDSIASMTGAITAGLGGSAAVPVGWVREIESASRMRFAETAEVLADVAIEILATDAERERLRSRSLAEMLRSAEQDEDEGEPLAAI